VTYSFDFNKMTIGDHIEIDNLMKSDPGNVSAILKVACRIATVELLSIPVSEIGAVVEAFMIAHSHHLGDALVKSGRAAPVDETVH
jgi:hypothetical protein